MRIPFHILAASVSLAMPALAAVSPPGGLTSSITASADEEPAFVLRAEGTHVFECKPLSTDPDRYAWFFSAPDATLYDAGRPVARNSAENMFEAIGDRSTVTGSIRARQDGGAHDLPWIHLRAPATAHPGLSSGA